MARYGCLVVAVVIATVVLFFIVYLWSGWLNRPVGHAPTAAGVGYEAPAVVTAAGLGLQRVLPSPGDTGGLAGMD